MAIGLVVVALRPPTALSPGAFLGTLALGAGLGVVAVAGFEFVVSRIVAPDGRPPEESHTTGGSEGDTGGGSLAAAEDFLRGGGGAKKEDVRRGGPERAGSGPALEDDADEDEFIWGEDREADEG